MFGPGSLTPEEALALAGRLNTAEAAGWPKGFDRDLVVKAWNEVLWTLSDHYDQVKAATPEIAPMLYRQYMRAIKGVAEVRRPSEQKSLIIPDGSGR